MTSKELVFAAMEGRSIDRFPVIVPYTGIFLRDHWEEITELPWWTLSKGDISDGTAVKRSLQEKLDLDWVETGLCASRRWRERQEVELKGGRVYLLDKETGRRNEIIRDAGSVATSEQLVKTYNDVDRLVPTERAEDVLRDGRADQVVQILEEFGDRFFISASVGTPFWQRQSYLGIWAMMTILHDDPDLSEYLAQRLLGRDLEIIRAYARIGIHGVFIEECLTSADMISLDHFRRFAIPYTKAIIDEVHALGMKSIYYFCGDPHDRLEDLVAMAPTCLSLEESKKGFEIDIGEIDRIVDGRVCLLGNLDAIDLLPNGSLRDLEDEIKRQLCVGSRHGRFIMSLGSPVTPGTPTRKVRQYVDITKRCGGSLVSGE